jgi:hypothetical protein
MKKIKTMVVAVSLIVCCALSVTLVYAKTVTPKKGFYVCKSGSNCQRMAINKVKGNKITFELAYSGMSESSSTRATVKLKNNKAKFTVEDEWGNEMAGTIKIISKKKIKVQCNGDALFAAGKWITYTYINSDTDIHQIY